MTQPMPQTQVIIDWITSLGWNATQETGFPLYPGPQILDAPDRSVWITLNPGPGYITEEGSLDGWGFQAMVRGGADDPAGPELAAIQLDQMIFSAPLPTVIDGVAVVHADRLGSPPVPLPVDPSDLRHSFTCSYVILTGV